MRIAKGRSLRSLNGQDGACFILCVSLVLPLAPTEALAIIGPSNWNLLMMIRTLTFGLFAVSASAATEEDTSFALSGAGSLECKAWKDTRALKNQMMDQIFVSWSQGFLSSINVMRLKVGDKAVPHIPKAEELLALIDSGCSSSPELPVYGVALKMYVQLPTTAVGSN